ncbi:hypothetical protein JW711_02655 [Candidatus Woesearchaeota archaeon]|nr:hypothetical protein [Candidatus Woesearchaeota archaeon]
MSWMGSLFWKIVKGEHALERAEPHTDCRKLRRTLRKLERNQVMLRQVKVLLEGNLRNPTNITSIKEQQKRFFMLFEHQLKFIEIVSLRIVFLSKDVLMHLKHVQDAVESAKGRYVHHPEGKARWEETKRFIEEKERAVTRETIQVLKDFSLQEFHHSDKSLRHAKSRASDQQLEREMKLEVNSFWNQFNSCIPLVNSTKKGIREDNANLIKQSWHLLLKSVEAQTTVLRRIIQRRHKIIEHSYAMMEDVEDLTNKIDLSRFINERIPGQSKKEIDALQSEMKRKMKELRQRFHDFVDQSLKDADNLEYISKFV